MAEEYGRLVEAVTVGVDDPPERPAPLTKILLTAPTNSLYLIIQVVE